MMYMHNADACEKFQLFFVSELTSRLRNGSLQFVGKVGEVDPPHLVMPLTTEPSRKLTFLDCMLINKHGI